MSSRVHQAMGIKLPMDLNQYCPNLAKQTDTYSLIVDERPAAAVQAPPPAATEAEPAVVEGPSVKSPMVGTFYTSPSPDADPFVKEGDIVTVGQTVCIIEAMKIMNEIEAEVGGRVSKVLVENGAPVEYDTPLFTIDPA